MRTRVERHKRGKFRLSFSVGIFVLLKGENAAAPVLGLKLKLSPNLVVVGFCCIFAEKLNDMQFYNLIPVPLEVPQPVVCYVADFMKKR